MTAKTASATPKTRVEKDTMGEIPVESSRYW
jgi:fumarate hydratase class II